MPTLTRTNVPMNNRVILFREPIRLSAVQKARVGATRNETEKEADGEANRETQGKRKEVKERHRTGCTVSPGIAA